MFRCPVHMKMSQLAEPCNICGETIDYFESQGYKFEEMLHEVTKEDLYALIREYKQKRS